MEIADVSEASEDSINVKDFIKLETNFHLLNLKSKRDSITD